MTAWNIVRSDGHGSGWEKGKAALVQAAFHIKKPSIGSRKKLPKPCVEALSYQRCWHEGLKTQALATANCHPGPVPGPIKKKAHRRRQKIFAANNHYEWSKRPDAPDMPCL
jgi:hypothetical protein